MSERTIQRLKHKFIVTAMVSFAAVMLFMAGAIYFTNLALTRGEIREVMTYIIANGGYLNEDATDSQTVEEAAEEAQTAVEAGQTEEASEADTEEENSETGENADEDDTISEAETGDTEESTTDDIASTGTTETAMAAESASTISTAAGGASRSTIESVTGTIERPGRGTADTFRSQLQNLFGVGSNYDSPEFFYSTRYFAVVYGQDGGVANVITQHIAAIDRPQAVQYANQVKQSWIHFGSFGDYYYEVATDTDGSQIVVFLDCTSQLAMSRRIMYVSLILIGAGMILSWIVLRAVAGRIVQPEVRNAEMQKSFITNASHELKTPLAVIRANTELQEMMTGENEWSQSTLRQVDRMQGLIQNLVMITRAQEQDNKVERSNIDISKAVEETAKTFAPVASQEGKQLVPQIQAGITMEAEEGQIRQLTSVLVDNAIKYCDENGTITVVLERKSSSRFGGRGSSNVRLAVSNNYAAGKNEDYRRFFDRFYRADQSHNQDKGGYGIGLSIAQNLVEQYHGTIDASWADGVITFTCLL